MTAPASSPGAAPVRVLLVDDSIEDRELYRRLLLQDREHSYVFLEAESGEEGLERIESDRPDCLLLDYRLPDVDGLEFLDRLPAEGLLPVIVLTGQGNEAVAVEAMKKGAQDYLLKGSISRESLQRAVHNAIEKVALRRKVEERTAQLAQANEDLRREIGERRRAEEALQHMYEDLEILVQQRTAELSRAMREAEEANRMKDEFLATLSHELRTPLSAMLGWAQMLRTGRLDEATTSRALETIERNARAQSQLISDLLDVSRIITGKLRLDLRTLELPSVIEAALDSIRPAAEAKGVRLEVGLDRLISPILGDADRLQQVIWNLLSNAVKFTPKGGRVEVRVVNTGEHLEVRVSDTGLGIRPDFLPYVFDRFRQAESASTRSHGGLGLGLSIVRHLVELHGGLVEVESAGEGQGSTFRVRLPVWSAMVDGLPCGPTEQESSGALLAETAWLAGIRVLVLEDEDDTRDLLVAALEGCGAEVAAVGSAAAALDLLDRRLPDVVVSDIGMPEEDGYAFIRRLRERSPERGGQLPVVALTAYARAEDRTRALASGFQTHLAKPLEPGTLVQTVAGLAGRAK
ncbi:MAG TPA: response regulator [Thermoanaerobaculia bacterium]|nr:response regulator [Thermoanaerobaculia bacterium]